jgi:hypothetical protein
MTGIHRLSAVGVIGAGPTPKTKQATNFDVVCGSEEHAEILLEKSAGRLCLRITSCTNNVVFHWGPVTFVFRLIHCHQHASVNSLSIQEPSGQIVTNYSERLAGFLVLQSQRERARYLRLRRGDTHAPKEQIIFYSQRLGFYCNPPP